MATEVIIEVGEASVVNNGFHWSEVCKGGGPCGFLDARTSSTDARERKSSKRKLWIAIVLCVTFMCVEVVGGIKANHLSIYTDATHLFCDVAALAISLFSLWASGREATPRHSYGFFRVEILGALLSIQLIWLQTGIIVYEAIQRLLHDSGEVKGFLMFGISTLGLIFNIVMAILLGHDHGHGHGRGHGHDHAHWHGHHDIKNKQRNINMQGAYLHVLGDSIQSIGVTIGGAIIWYKPHLKIIDLVCTLIFSAVVLFTTIRMVWNIIELLMESTTPEIDATRLENGICEMEEVVAIHELHIWAITVGKVLLSCHVKINPDADADKVLEKVIDYIRREYNISHVTIQIEQA